VALSKRGKSSGVNYFFCDASALGKRYVAEAGSPVMNHLFDSVPYHRLVMLTQSLGETLSIIVRRRNAGALSAAAYQHAIHALRTELISAGRARLRPTEDTLAFSSLPLIEKHFVNSTDALILGSALDMATTLRASGHSLVLLGSDTRLLRAALVEGLVVYNPETDALADLATLIHAS
jgi:uncharacterized protein